MIADKLPSGYIKNPRLHAYLFVSGDLTDRRNAARSIAKSMLCRNPGEGSLACGECDCCIKMQASSHPDCIFVSGDEKTTVEDIRKIEEEAYLASNEADSKVFILEDADEYNVSCQNKLLKIIEEPPAGVRFILTASSQGALLPTVRSRVCMLSGSVRSYSDVIDAIRKQYNNISDETAQELAYFVLGYDKADVSALDADKISDYVNCAHMFLSGKDSGIILTLPRKREELMLCLQVFMLALRQVALVKCTGGMTDGILVRTKLLECNAKTSMKRAHALYDVFEEAYLLAEGYANVNAVLSYLLENAK